MSNELFDFIYEAVTDTIHPETDEELAFSQAISLAASFGAKAYVAELEESIGHLKDTIKRLQT